MNFFNMAIPVTISCWLLMKLLSVNMMIKSNLRSSHRRCSGKKRLLRNFTKIHRKTPVRESLFYQSCKPQLAILIKKRLWHRCFPVNFAKSLRTSFFYRTLLSDCFCNLLTKIVKSQWKLIISLNKTRG